MRMLMIVLTAVASVLVPGWAEAVALNDPGEGFINHKQPKVTEDYYVVRKGDDGKCSIVPGAFGNKPVGVVGDRAVQSSPECRGGLADDANKGSG
jgi:hypothetical protein